MAKYANVIVDISLEKLDKTFQYRIPEEQREFIVPGVQVEVPFGARRIAGYVVEITDQAEFDESKIKDLLRKKEGSVAIESQLIALAGWMKKNYGSTMNQALKAVLPIKREKKSVEHRRVSLVMEKEKAQRQLAIFEQKHYTARARLLRELIQQESLDYEIVTQKLGISGAVIKAFEEQKIIVVTSTKEYRNPIAHLKQREYHINLNEQQQAAVDAVTKRMEVQKSGTFLLKGVTGSGKTEVYMELIAHALRQKKQAIVLIPEIALTYQTVMRFYNRFGNRVSILNSRMSAGERYDQYLRAKNGDIDIMIGPRSALFAPFENLGIIIIDEEHENSYKSESAPRYHARETAIKRAEMAHAVVVLGSATPSVESYYRAKKGEYVLLTLDKRVKEKPLAECEVVDLRKELLEGNRSILSVRLQELMEDRLKKGQQIMLFLNRRGFSGFLSCRACGYVVKCPHCDVTLSMHNNGKMVCHYCGYTEAVPRICPSCGSKYIAGFKAGTQQIEQMVQNRFKTAKILRMDFDTTRTKDSYEHILQKFSNRQADILIGTQMIVKGHDFENVTLVGILAADMSLHVNDYHASERTFQLLTQAAGRAGRGDIPGNVVIQTYRPDHFAIEAAKEQNYLKFYEQEMEYRKLLHYPPVSNLLVIFATGPNAEELSRAAEYVARRLKSFADDDEEKFQQVQIIGPADATIAKVSDIYRKVIYIKTGAYHTLVEIKDRLEPYLRENQLFRTVTIQYDFNPMSGF